MPYLVDGHNLIGKIPGMSLSDIDDELELCRRLEAFCRQVRRKAEVYFDGAPPGSSRSRKVGMLTAHFVRQGKSADAAIEERLERMGGAAGGWTVVSSDQRVQRAALKAHARAVSAEEFLQIMEGAGAAKSAGEKPETGNVEDWLKVFGDK